MLDHSRSASASPRRTVSPLARSLCALAATVALLLGGTAPAPAAAPLTIPVHRTESGPPDYRTPTSILKGLPFAPTNINLFNPAIYPAARDYAPASKRMTDRQILKTLKSSLVHRLGTKKTARAYKLLDNKTLKKVVPDLSLRASVVNLTGTVMEPTIRHYLDGTFSSYTIGPVPGGIFENSIAVAGEAPDGTRFAVLNQKYRQEDFRLLTPITGHEALHSGNIPGANPVTAAKEELVANTIDSEVYLQLLLENPRLARGKTELAQRLNSKAMARINTRDDRTGELRLFESEGTVYPVSTKGQAASAALDSFGAAFDLSGNLFDTPGSTVLDKVLTRLTGTKVRGADFDDETIALLDRDSTHLTPRQLLTVAKEALLLDAGRKS